jgi:DNA-binding response OmpR family regulator
MSAILDDRAQAAMVALVLDDDPSLHELLGDRLHRLGFHVRRATTGEEALVDAAAHPPDLVLLDLMLPGLDGWAVARHLRANSATAGVRIIVVSALDQAGEAPPVTIDAYLTKPFINVEFDATVRRVMARQPG